MRRRTLPTAALLLALVGCGLSALGTKDEVDGGSTASSSSSGGAADASADGAIDAAVDASDAPTCVCDGGLCAENVCKRPVFWVRGDDAVAGATFTWPDRSGNGNHATQSTAGLQPTIQSQSLSGHKVLRFPNSARLLVANASAFQPGTGDVVWFHVSSNLGNNAVEKNQVFGTLLDVNPFSGITAGYDVQNRPYAMFRQGIDVFITASSPSTQGSFGVYDMRRTAGNAELRRNGSSIATGVASMSVNGGQIVVGAERATGTEHLNGDIAEIILFAGTPFTDAERASVAKGLGALYGITVQ